MVQTVEVDLDARVRKLRMTCWQGRMEELALELEEATPDLRASSDARHGLWSDVLRARLILYGEDPTGATRLVRAAHDGFYAATNGPERANSIAFLSELYAQAGHADLATDLTIIAGEIIDHHEAGTAGSADLIEACCWLSRTLATLGLFEPAAQFAERGLELSAAPGARSWPGLTRYTAFMHLLRAEELDRAGEGGSAVAHITAAEMRLGPTEPRGKPTDREIHEAMTALLAGWVALARDQVQAADRLFERATLLGRSAGVGWLEVAATYLRGRSSRQAGQPDRARVLLAEAATGLARWSWHRMHEWCLLDLIDLETDRGDQVEAMRWMDTFLRRRAETQRRRQELAKDLFLRRVAVLNESRQRSTFARHALEDPLTGLANRRHAEQCLADLLVDESQAPICLAVVDVDEFKRVNDEASHTMGDAVLVRVAELIDANTHVEDLVARWAGDEFVVVMPTTTEEEACTAMDQLRHAVADHDWEQLGLGLPVSVSIGVARAADGSSARSLFDAADAPLFAAKRAGRNRVMTAAQALVASGSTAAWGPR